MALVIISIRLFFTKLKQKLSKLSKTNIFNFYSTNKTKEYYIERHTRADPVVLLLEGECLEFPCADPI